MHFPHFFLIYFIFFPTVEKTQNFQSNLENFSLEMLLQCLMGIFICH